MYYIYIYILYICSFRLMRNISIGASRIPITAQDTGRLFVRLLSEKHLNLFQRLVFGFGHFLVNV